MVRSYKFYLTSAAKTCMPYIAITGVFMHNGIHWKLYSYVLYSCEKVLYMHVLCYTDIIVFVI